MFSIGNRQSAVGNSDPLSSESPWPGLSSFTEDTRGFFFGREKETDELFRLVRRETLTVLFGQSGLGKSSLLQAGLFPLLRDADYLPLYLRLDHSLPIDDRQLIIGHDLAEQVKAALNAAFIAASADAPPTGPEQTLWEYFHRKDVDIWSAKNRLLTPVLVFDQFEEMFTLGRADDVRRERSRAFLTELADLIENRAPAALRETFDRGEADPARYNFDKPSCRVILSLREDFLPDLEGLKRELPALIHNRLRLKRLNGAQALEAVSRPAPHLLAEGVGEKIVEFVAGVRGGSEERLLEMEVEPALLSVICRELNERRRALGQTQITADLVSGNRREILTDFYERSVADLPEQMRAFVEDHLLTKSGFRDNLALETALDFPGVTRPLIDTLVSRRLLRIEDRLGVQRVELTHDVLAEVIRASRDARQQRISLEQAREREARAHADAARRTRRMRFAIGGLVAAVIALSIGAVFGIRAQRLSTRQASHTDFVFGSRLLDEGKLAEGLAYLVRAGHKDPTNPVIGPRLLTTLAARNFSLPVQAPVRLPSPATWAKYSTDGKRLFVQSSDNSVSIIDAGRWQVERTLDFGSKVQPGGLRLAASNNAVFAVALSDDTLHVCDTATGKSRLELKPGESFEFTPVFELSPDGRWLAARSTSTFWLWDANTGTLKHQRPIEASTRFPDIDFHPDSRSLAFEASPITYVISVPDGVPLWHYTNTNDRRSYYASFSGDGKKLLVHYSGQGFFIFDAASGEKLFGPIPTSAGRPVVEAFLNRDATKLVYVLANQTVNVMNVATGKSAFAPLPHKMVVASAEFDASEQRLLTSSIDGVIRLWDMESGKLLAEPTFKKEHHAPAVLSPSGNTLAVFSRSKFGFHMSVGSGAAAPLILPDDGHMKFANFFATAPTRIAWVTRTEIKAIEPATGRQEQGVYTFPSQIISFDIGPAGSRRESSRIRPGGGRTLGAGNTLVVHTDAKDGTKWRAYFLADKHAVNDIPLLDVPPQIVTFIHGRTGKVAAGIDVLSSRDTLRCWDLNTGKLLSTITSDKVFSGSTMTISPDGRFVAFLTTEDSIAHICSTTTGQERFALRLPYKTAAPRTSRFTADGKYLLTSDDVGGVHVWDLNDGRLVQSREAHRAAAGGVEFSEDGKFYATLSTDGSTQVWDSATHTEVGALVTHVGAVFRASFSPSGKRIATTGVGSARVWDVMSGHASTPVMDHGRERVGDIAYSPDGKFLLTTASGGTVRVWAAPPTIEGKRTPQWIFDLATICAGQRITDDGKIISSESDYGKIDEIRRIVTNLPATDSCGEWARWFLSTSTTRSIAPGFIITPAEAKKLQDEFRASARSASSAAP